ncbi:MAG: GNAT family N-acetyltransferase [Elsteraceae bacterium]
MLLRVRPDQRDFVATNLSSLIQAWSDRSAHALAIYNGARMVGFALVAFEPHERVWWICRLMIDRDAQGLGFGRGAMMQILERLKRAPGCDRVLIGHHPANAPAQRLYLSLGFRPTGRRLGIEEILELRFTPPAL